MPNEYHTHKILCELSYGSTQETELFHSHVFEPGGHTHDLICGPATVTKEEEI